jgi:hypothetical protein
VVLDLVHSGSSRKFRQHSGTNPGNRIEEFEK